MSKITENKVRICNWICVALMLILMICQFTPFWTVPETGERVSIGAYVAFPQEEADLESYLEDTVGEDYNINGVVLGPVCIIALGAVGIVLCLIKSENPLCALLPIAVGGVGAWGYLTKAALQLGSGWGLHLALCILTLAAGVVTVVVGVPSS